MMYRRVGTKLLFNVTNPDLIALYEGNEAYEKVEEKKPEPEKEEKKTTRKK